MQFFTVRLVPKCESAPLLRQDQALVVFIQGLLVFARHEIFVTLLFQFLCTTAIFSAFEYCFEAELSIAIMSKTFTVSI